MNNEDLSIFEQKYYKDSYCGLFCGACEIMLAYQRENEKGRTASWADISEEMRTHIKEAEVKCFGCKSDIVFLGYQGCKIRKCAKEKKIEFCNDCPDYPCYIVNEMKNNIKPYETTLPHTKTILNNLDDIKLKGKEVWIAEQEELWKCPECGARRSWYQKICDRCQKELKSVF